MSDKAMQGNERSVEPNPGESERTLASVLVNEEEQQTSREGTAGSSSVLKLGKVSVVQKKGEVLGVSNSVDERQSDPAPISGPTMPALAQMRPQAEEQDADWIDRTNEPLGEIGNGYTLTPALTSLYLTNNRIKELKNLSPCKCLRELVLRQNAITVVEGLDSLCELVELDLYMNQIVEVPPSSFKANPKLKRLDLSFNELRTLESFPFTNLPNLEELYFIGNKIKNISPIPEMPKLLMLELGDNRIRDVENLEKLTSLEGLWLGRNKLTEIRNLESLTNLRKLSLQSNRLEVIEGLGHLHQLEELYLSHNGIKSMEGLEALTKLRVLDLGVNFIEHIEGLEELVLLEEFWINGNRLQSFDELKVLCNTTKLATVYLEGNPLASDPEYQMKVLSILPNTLEQLDALMVSDIRKSLLENAENDNPQKSTADGVDDVAGHEESISARGEPTAAQSESVPEQKEEIAREGEATAREGEATAKQE